MLTRNRIHGVVGALALALVALAGHARGGDTKEHAWDYAVDVGANLYEIDCEQLVWHNVGPIRIPLEGGGVEVPKLYDLAASPDGFLYGISSEILYLIRLENPSESIRIGRHGISNPYGMQAGPKGELLVNNLEGDVYVVDRKTAKATKIGPMEHGFVASGDIAVVTTVVGGTADKDKPPVTLTFSSVKDESGHEHLVRLDLKTGEATDVGFLVDEDGASLTNVFGMICRKETLYGLTTAGDILKIDPFTAKCLRLKRTGITWWGATDYNRF